MCSQDFNNWWLWCNKIPDTLQRVPFGNAGVVCWKLYSCEAGSSFELLEPPCCCKPTAAKHWFAGKTYFSIALRGEKENKSLFSPCSLISFFHEGKWNSDYSLWSCVLGFCLKCFFLNWNTFPVNVFHFFLVFCLSCKLCLQTMGLHIIMITPSVRKEAVRSKETGSLFCRKTNLELLIFP